MWRATEPSDWSTSALGFTKGRWYSRKQVSGEPGGVQYLSLPRLNRPPRPLALTIDPRDRLWVFVSGWSAESDSGWSTRIEVVDPTDGSIVATGELDERVFETSGHVLYSLEEHELGFVFLRIWSKHLRELEGRGTR